MDKLMIKIENVSKQYKLGQIGGTTLRDELQRRRAKRRGEEDPTRKIGAKEYTPGETFMALDGVSFAVKKGERVGIIGHNGAGKSTLLKLLSRVTAPSAGTIKLNGRVASMLEVGTGFHPELTGRENIYMNGAILGMTKKEIDAKIEDIIDFSECRQFIDTPVKRYSSGMYVKLAFSVAAHLDSEIMIMDEVLAVGDMAFQKKCLDKMSDVSKSEGRTILYVSHNMNTIRQLCDRVVVLDHGHVVFDGDVEDGIGVYMGGNTDYKTVIEFGEEKHRLRQKEMGFEMKKIRFENTQRIEVESGHLIPLVLSCHAEKKLTDVFFRFEIKTQSGENVGTVFTVTPVHFDKGNKDVCLEFNTAHIAPGQFFTDIIAFQKNEYGQQILIDGVYPGFSFASRKLENDIVWLGNYWGPTHLHDIRVLP